MATHCDTVETLAASNRYDSFRVDAIHEFLCDPDAAARCTAEECIAAIRLFDYDSYRVEVLRSMLCAGVALPRDRVLAIISSAHDRKHAIAAFDMSDRERARREEKIV